MGSDDIVLNLTYIIFVSAPLLRDELHLRIGLTLASVGFTIWALLIDSPWTIAWNALFLAMSLRTIARLVRDRRPVELTSDCESIRQRLFPEMTSSEFSRFWNLGEDHRVVDGQIAVQGESLQWFWIFLDGDVQVELSDRVVTMDPLSTIGGISYVMGDDVAASASVFATDAHLRRWSKSTLRSLAQTDPELTAPFLSGVGRGLVSKIPT